MAEEKFLDLDNLENFVNEDEAKADPEANAFIPPAPPLVPPGVYLTRWKFREEQPKKHWGEGRKKTDNGEKRWAFTFLRGEVIEGEENTKKLDSGYVSTMLFKNGASKVMGIVKALGGKVVASDESKGVTHKDQCMALERTIGGSGAICRVSVDYEATFYTKIGDQTVNITDDAIVEGGPARITGTSSGDWPKEEKDGKLVPKMSWEKPMKIRVTVEDDDGGEVVKEIKVTAKSSVRNVVLDFKPVTEGGEAKGKGK